MFSSKLGVVHDDSGAKIFQWYRYRIILHKCSKEVIMRNDNSISVPTQITVYLYRGGYALYVRVGALKQPHSQALTRGPEPNRLPVLVELQQGPGQMHSRSCCGRHTGCV
jgi:hypothetical protein